MTIRYKPFNNSEFDRALSNSKVIPLSQKEVRILTLGLLGISPDDCILDIGAGTGGLSLEAARIAYNGVIFSIDMKKDACKIVKKNALKLNLNNVDVIEGKAPKILERLDDNLFNHIIIGASSGKFKKIIKWSYNHLKPNGSIVANFLTLENATKYIKQVQKVFKNCDITFLNVAKGQNFREKTLLKALNPTIIVYAQKEAY